MGNQGIDKLVMTLPPLYRCHPDLQNACDITDAGTEREKWQINVDKLGTLLLAVDDKLVTEEKEEEEENFSFLCSPMSARAAGKQLPITPIPIASHDYDKNKHGQLELLTVSTDPDIEYPETLKVVTLHRFSPDKGGTLPPLKGVKTLYVDRVSCSLDLTPTCVTSLVIGYTEFGLSPAELDDYEIFPVTRFLDYHGGPPCLITVKGGNVKVGRSKTQDPYSSRPTNRLEVSGPTYVCDKLTVDICDGELVSTCRILQLHPTKTETDAWSAPWRTARLFTPQVEQIVLLEPDVTGPRYSRQTIVVSLTSETTYTH